MSTPSRTTSALHGVLWSMINTAGPTLITMLVFLVTSRLLRPVDFGIVALATSISVFAACFVPHGFGDALVQRAEIRPVHHDTVFWICLGVAVIVYLPLAGGSVLFARLMGQRELVFLLPLLALRVVFDAASIVPYAVVRRNLLFRALAIRSLVTTMIAGAATLTLAIAGFGFWALVASQLISSLVGMAGAFWAARWRPRGGPHRAAYRDLAAFGGYNSATRTIATLNQQGDQAVVGFALGVVPLGLYAFGRRTLSILTEVISGTLTTVALPLMSAVANERAALVRGFLLASFASSLIGFPVFFGLACVAPDLVPVVFGDQWNAAVPTVQLLSLLGVLMALGMLQASLINSLGHARWWFWYQLLTIVTYFGTILIFARHGLNVMMVALVVRGFLFVPLAYDKTLRLIALPFRRYFEEFAGPLAASGGMVAMLLARRALLPIAGHLAACIVDIGLGATLYGTLLLLLSRARLTQIVDIFRGALHHRRLRNSAADPS